MHKRTSILFLALYIVAVISVTFFVLEYAIRFLRLAPPLPSAEFVHGVDNLPFREKPDNLGHSRPWPGGDKFDFPFKTNSMGFRDVEHSLEKPEGVFRILTIGDSYTAGSGAPFGKSYPFQLDRFMNERLKGNPPVEIINAGQARYWPEPERILLENIGVKFFPDLILVEFTPNDITDTYLGMNFNFIRGHYLVSREGHRFGDIGIWAYLHSHLLRAVVKIYLDQKFKRLAYGNPAGGGRNGIFVPRGDSEKYWKNIESEHDKMIRAARRIGAKIAFIYIPSRPYEPDYASKRLVEWGRRRGVLVVDTLPALNKAARSEKVCWDKDIHYNETGYRHIAEIACTKLIDSYF